MLINFSDICRKFNYHPTGVIHLGAHKAEELDSYILNGIQKAVWVEANPDIFKEMQNKVSRVNGHVAFNALISDENGHQYDFKITNNGESSSILDFGKHSKYHPQVIVTDVIKLYSTRLDSLIKDNGINPEEYQFMNIDLQGVELQALKGYGELIKNLTGIYTEINTSDVYKNCTLLNELDEYLSTYGFERVETKMTEYEWGDAFYLKKDKPQSKLFFDIGCNKGDYCNHILSVYDNARIICLEANPELAFDVKNRFSRNHNITVINLAVAEESGKKIDFFISDADTISTASKNWVEHSRFSKNYKWDKKIEIETTTLDDLVKTYGAPDLIKVDVEGYELEVLHGLKKRANKLCFEWAEEEKQNILLSCKHLREIGYDNFGFIEGDVYMKEPDSYLPYDEFLKTLDMDENRKEKWGMIWAK